MDKLELNTPTKRADDETIIALLKQIKKGKRLKRG